MAALNPPVNPLSLTVKVLPGYPLSGLTLIDQVMSAEALTDPLEKGMNVATRTTKIKRATFSFIV